QGYWLLPSGSRESSKSDRCRAPSMLLVLLKLPCVRKVQEGSRRIGDPAVSTPRLRRTASPSRAPMAHRVSHSGGSSRQAPHGPGHIAAPVRGRRPALAPRDWRRGGSAYQPHTTAAELLSPDAPAPC